MASFERNCFVLCGCLNTVFSFLDENKQFGSSDALSGRMTELEKLIEEMDQDVQQKELELETFSLVIQNLNSEMGEKRTDQTRDLGGLQEERVTHSDQLRDLSKDDLKEFPFIMV